jgi:hypothetical protein
MVDATQQVELEGQVRSGRNAKRDWKGGNVCNTVERQICDSGARVRKDDVGEAGKLGRGDQDDPVGRVPAGAYGGDCNWRQ